MNGWHSIQGLEMNTTDFHSRAAALFLNPIGPARLPEFPLNSLRPALALHPSDEHLPPLVMYPLSSLLNLREAAEALAEQNRDETPLRPAHQRQIASQVAAARMQLHAQLASGDRKRFLPPETRDFLATLDTEAIEKMLVHGQLEVEPSATAFPIRFEVIRDLKAFEPPGLLLNRLATEKKLGIVKLPFSAETFLIIPGDTQAEVSAAPTFRVRRREALQIASTRIAGANTFNTALRELGLSSADLNRPTTNSNGANSLRQLLAADENQNAPGGAQVSFATSATPSDVHLSVVPALPGDVPLSTEGSPPIEDRFLAATFQLLDSLERQQSTEIQSALKEMKALFEKAAASEQVPNLSPLQRHLKQTLSGEMGLLESLRVLYRDLSGADPIKQALEELHEAMELPSWVGIKKPTPKAEAAENPINKIEFKILGKPSTERLGKLRAFFMASGLSEAQIKVIAEKILFHADAADELTAIHENQSALAKQLLTRAQANTADFNRQASGNLETTPRTLMFIQAHTRYYMTEKSGRRVFLGIHSHNSNQGLSYFQSRIDEIR